MHIPKMYCHWGLFIICGYTCEMLSHPFAKFPFCFPHIYFTTWANNLVYYKGSGAVDKLFYFIQPFPQVLVLLTYLQILQCPHGYRWGNRGKYTIFLTHYEPMHPLLLVLASQSNLVGSPKSVLVYCPATGGASASPALFSIGPSACHT